MSEVSTLNSYVTNFITLNSELFNIIMFISSDWPDTESKMVNLSKLPLLTSAPFEGLLSSLDHSPVIRETLRDYLELDVETMGIGIADSVMN